MKWIWLDRILRGWLVGSLSTGMVTQPVQAATYYVNAGTGNDSRTGTQAQSANTPWRTLSRAVQAQELAQGDTIQVSAGTYNLALGESFPIYLPNGIQVVGSGPTTQIIGDNQDAVIAINGSLNDNTWLSSVSLDAVHTDQRMYGIQVQNEDGAAQIIPHIDNVSFGSKLWAGIHVDAPSYPLEFAPTIENSTFTADAHGLQASFTASTAVSIRPEIAACQFNVGENAIDFELGANDADFEIAPWFHDNTVTGGRTALRLDPVFYNDVTRSFVFSPIVENNTFTGLEFAAFSLNTLDGSNAALESHITVTGNTATDVENRFFQAFASSLYNVAMDIDWQVRDNTFDLTDPYAIGIDVGHYSAQGDIGTFALTATSNTITEAYRGIKFTMSSASSNNLTTRLDITGNDITGNQAGVQGIQTYISGTRQGGYRAGLTLTNNTISSMDNGIVYSASSLNSGTYDADVNISGNTLTGGDTGISVNSDAFSSVGGDAVWSVRDNTVDGSGFPLTLTYTSMQRREHQLDLTVSGNTITESPNSGIYGTFRSFSSASMDLAVQVEGNSVTDVGGHGITLDVGGLRSSHGEIDLTLSNNTISGAGINGLYAGFSSLSSGALDASVAIRENSVFSSQGPGIDTGWFALNSMSFDSDIAVTDNYVDGTQGSGMSVRLEGLNSTAQRSRTFVAGNSISGHSTYGVNVTGSNWTNGSAESSVMVVGNTVSKTGYEGLHVGYANLSSMAATLDVDVLNNRADGYFDAINVSLTSSSSARGDVDMNISGNTVVDPGSDGAGVLLDMYGLSDNLRYQSLDVSGNQIDGQSLGMLLLPRGESTASNYMRVADNHVINARNFGIKVLSAGAGSPVVMMSGNTVTGNGGAGISLSAGQAEVLDVAPDLGGGLLGSPGFNTLSGNGTGGEVNFDLVNGFPDTVAARNNFWGTTADIDARIDDDNETEGRGAVDFTGSRSAQPTAAFEGTYTAVLLEDVAPVGPSAGDTLRYTATLRSTGQIGHGVAGLYSEMSSNVAIVTGSVHTSRGIDYSRTRDLRVALGSLPAGETATVTWDLELLPDESCGQIGVGATFTSASLGNINLTGVASDSITDPRIISVQTTYYADQDADGYGGSSLTACTGLPVGYTTQSGDCDDTSADIHPGATEAAGDGIDQNCDGAELCFVDGDGDGYRTGNATLSSNNASCTDAGEASTTTPTGDCNDGDGSAYPGALEACDFIDSDCDGSLVDELRDADENTVPDCAQDTDGDGVNDGEDLCPYTSDAAQEDLDDDGLGDACDADADGDGDELGLDCDDADPSTSELTPFYADGDDDGLGDSADPLQVCGTDAPDGYVATGGDNCPSTANGNQTDSDGDGLGDACDVTSTTDGDRDEDGTTDSLDNCPTVANATQEDRDEDGAGDACDTDADGDGFALGTDCDDTNAAAHAFATYYHDSDGDGLGDGSIQARACADAAPDGYVSTPGDNCPLNANPDQADSDEDGYGDACDIEATPSGDVEGGGGCSISPSRHSTPSANLLFPAMVLLLLRRRRR